MKIRRIAILLLAVSQMAPAPLALGAGERGSAAEAPVNDAAVFGGFVEQPAKGVIALCDYQSKVSREEMEGFFLPSNGFFRLRFVHRRMTGSFDIRNAGAAKGTAAVAIFIVDDPALPMTLAAPEAKWGVLNTAQISAGTPERRLLLERADKLMSRVGTELLGGIFALQVPFSAMQPVYSVADLDRMNGKAISPQSLTQIAYTLPRIGVFGAWRTTYDQAVREGWAPAPTNDVQRAIWDEVKKGGK